MISMYNQYNPPNPDGINCFFKNMRLIDTHCNEELEQTIRENSFSTLPQIGDMQMIGLSFFVEDYIQSLLLP